mgnify:CR=1 FL=1
MSTVNKRISVSHPVFRGNEKQYVAECIDTVWISSIGKFIPLFENAFSSFCGVKHAIACNNGTSALHIALLALGIGTGTAELVTPLTYVAAANAIHYCGATPVFVDSDIKTMNIDPHLMESAITPQTRAILVVHLYGQPADMAASAANRWPRAGEFTAQHTSPSSTASCTRGMADNCSGVKPATHSLTQKHAAVCTAAG